ASLGGRRAAGGRARGGKLAPARFLQDSARSRAGGRRHRLSPSAGPGYACRRAHRRAGGAHRRDAGDLCPPAHDAGGAGGPRSSGRYRPVGSAGVPALLRGRPDQLPPHAGRGRGFRDHAGKGDAPLAHAGRVAGGPVSMFTTVWEYEVDEGSRRAFELAYGKDGDWVRLFRQAHGYQETALLHDVEDPRRYVTLDRWSSRAAYEEFRIVHAAAYA